MRLNASTTYAESARLTRQRCTSAARLVRLSTLHATPWPSRTSARLAATRSRSSIRPRLPSTACTKRRSEPSSASTVCSSTLASRAARRPAPASRSVVFARRYVASASAGRSRRSVARQTLCWQIGQQRTVRRRCGHGYTASRCRVFYPADTHAIAINAIATYVPIRIYPGKRATKVDADSGSHAPAHALVLRQLYYGG